MRFILLIVMLPFLTAQAYGSIYITDVKIIPEEINVNDTLTIEANIFNNSDEVIEYHSLCESPLDLKFDDNIAVEHAVGCLGFTIERLEPFTNTTVRGPASGLFYRVIDDGLTRGDITFTYKVDGGEKSIHKEIAFMIDGEKSTNNIISINKTILLNELEITLFDIKDFRCPKEVMCVWAGDAILSLAIKSGGYIMNTTINLYQPLLIDNKAIKVASLEPESTLKGIDKSEYKARLELIEPKDSIRFKAYNDKYGIIGVVDLERDQGLVILFKEGKREVLSISNYEECNRLGSMVCFNASNKHIEVSKDFVIIDKEYIPTTNLKLI